MPLYDLALDMIVKDSANIKKEASKLRKEIQDGSQRPKRELDEMNEELERLDILAEVNVPAVKWGFERGYGQ